MRCALLSRTIPAIGLGLALSTLSPSSLFAQVVPNQGLLPNSGSGSGTGTGMSSGFPGSTGTGRESSSGLGTTGREGMNTSPLPPAFSDPNLTRPIDRRPLGTRDFRPLVGMSTVSPDLFLDARSVADPGERALAMVRIAQTAIFSKQLDDAHTALFEAGPAALAERNSLIREQRLSAIIELLLRLAEERMGENSDIDLTAPDDISAPKPTPVDRLAGARRRHWPRRLPSTPLKSRSRPPCPPPSGSSG